MYQADVKEYTEEERKPEGSILVEIVDRDGETDRDFALVIFFL